MARHLSLLLAALLFALSASGCAGCEGSANVDGSLAPNEPGDAGDAAQHDGDDDAGLTDGGDENNGGCTTSVCNGICCADGEICVQGEYCRPPCSGTRCGAELELCCDGGDEICFAQQCLVPGDSCEQTEHCDLDEICEPTVGRCVPRDLVKICEFRPPVGEFEPAVGCAWPNRDGSGASTEAVRPSSDQVVVAPIVGNLTDDNDDGKTDADDVPEIVFLSRIGDCCNKRGTLRIVSGACNADGTMNTIASLDAVVMVNDSAPALGDLDGDGVPEIVAVKGKNLQTNDDVTPQGLVAWKRQSADGAEWAPMWENDTYPTWDVHTRGGAAVSIADLDADGAPEVIVGNVAINGQDGSLKWDGVVTSGGEGGIGNNAFLGPSSAVGDVDLDGDQEVAAGNSLYDADGTLLWTYPYTTENSACNTRGNTPCDGFTAMANFDADPEGEIVIIRLGELFILNHDGTLLWQQEIIKDNCSYNESGPPTIADFDGDGMPEVGTAAADFYTVMDMECDADPLPEKCLQRGVLWATPNNDCSSRVTASSVFDFEGDGKAEMVYADESNFRIFDGTTGAILFDDPTHDSNTRLEMPLVADVDNDGNSEVIITSATSRAVKVWKDGSDNWVRTRRIWNQHAYSVTNVTEDGAIPAQPEINWLDARLNNFRQNVQPAGLFDAPNLVLSDLAARGTGCGASFALSIRLEVTNDGALGVNAGVPVRVYALHDGSPTLIADLATTRQLLPGQREVFTVQWTVPDGAWLDDGFEVRAAVDPDLQTNECDEDDNDIGVASADITFGAPDLVLDAVEVDALSCGTARRVDVRVLVSNGGENPVPRDVPVMVTASLRGNVDEMGVVRTTRILLPGESETLPLSWSTPAAFLGEFFEVTATVDPNQEVYQCDATATETVTAECAYAN